MSIMLKVVYNQDIRRFEVGDRTWKELKETISSLYRLRGAFSIKYKDDEGDLIQISSDLELQEAKKLADKGILRFEVFKLSQEDKTPESSPIVLRKENKQEKSLIDFSEEKAPLKEDQEVEKQADTKSLIWKDIVCDICHNHPTGIRYRCLFCADFDLCDNCEKQLFINYDHPKDHPFVKLRSPLLVSTQPEIPQDLKSLITGFRENFIADPKAKTKIDQGKESLKNILSEIDSHANQFLKQAQEHQTQAQHFQRNYHELFSIKTNQIKSLARQCKLEGKNLRMEYKEAVQKFTALLKEEKEHQRQQTEKEVAQSLMEEEQQLQKLAESMSESSLKTSQSLETSQTSPKQDPITEGLLSQLVEMGFIDVERNALLLKKHNNNMIETIKELLD